MRIFKKVIGLTLIFPASVFILIFWTILLIVMVVPFGKEKD